MQRPVSQTNPQRQASGGSGHTLWHFFSLSGWACHFLGAIWTIVIFCVTTMPWSNFQGHSHWKNVCWLPFSDSSLKHIGAFAFDFFSNIALFFPFGFCFILAQGKSASNRLRRTVLYATAFSLIVELFQSSSHGRFASATDVYANIVGAAWGASIARRYREISQSEDWRGEEKEAA